MQGMASPIDPETLEHLTELARLKLEPSEKERLLRDLPKILEYFEELKGVKAEPGGSPEPVLKNVFRDDREREKTNEGKGKESFPETKRGFLKVPPVFGGE